MSEPATKRTLFILAELINQIQDDLNKKGCNLLPIQVEESEEDDEILYRRVSGISNPRARSAQDEHDQALKFAMEKMRFVFLKNEMGDIQIHNPEGMVPTDNEKFKAFFSQAI